jgi:cytochrome c-type biogenesis protein CcmH/NrfG
MSDDNQTAKAGWSSVQVYTLSAICLLIGVTMGYLFRGSTTPRAAAPAAVQSQMPGSQAGALPPNAAQPTQQDLKRMADKQVAPLLEQLKQNPNDADTMTKIANYYLYARQFEDAAKYLEMAANVHPTADAYTQLANAQYYGGSADAATASVNKALKIEPTFANALYTLGMLKWFQGDRKGAIECWEKLLKTNPNHPGRAKLEKMIAQAKEQLKVAPGATANKPGM